MANYSSLQYLSIFPYPSITLFIAHENPPFRKFSAEIPVNLKFHFMRGCGLYIGASLRYTFSSCPDARELPWHLILSLSPQNLLAHTWLFTEASFRVTQTVSSKSIICNIDIIVINVSTYSPIQTIHYHNHNSITNHNHNPIMIYVTFQNQRELYSSKHWLTTVDWIIRSRDFVFISRATPVLSLSTSHTILKPLYWLFAPDND